MQERDANGQVLNGLLVSALADLKATEAMPTIRAAYADNEVDISIPGDLEDIEIAMELRLVRDTPRPNYWRAANEDEELEDLSPLANEEVTGVIDDGWPVPVTQAVSGELASNPYRNVGRNDPCPCGSGKKFKKCCLLRM